MDTSSTIEKINLVDIKRNKLEKKAHKLMTDESIEIVINMILYFMNKIRYYWYNTHFLGCLENEMYKKQWNNRLRAYQTYRLDHDLSNYKFVLDHLMMIYGLNTHDSDCYCVYGCNDINNYEMKPDFVPKFHQKLKAQFADNDNTLICDGLKKIKKYNSDILFTICRMNDPLVYPKWIWMNRSNKTDTSERKAFKTSLLEGQIIINEPWDEKHVKSSKIDWDKLIFD